MRLCVAGSKMFGHTGGADPDFESRDVVVLVHGAGNDHSVWRYQTRLLAGIGVPVVAVDLPGHGRSDGPALDSVAGAGEWLVGLVGRLGATRATVVGHSMGSLIALAAAEAGGDRVDRIGLIGTAPRMAVHPALQAAADARDSLAVDLIVGWSHTGISRFGGHRQAGVWTVGQTRRLLQRNLGVLGVDLAACAAYDAESTARTLTRTRAIEALIISGGADRMTPARGGAAVAEMLGAPHVVVPGGSHVSLYDHPDQVNAALVGWLVGRGDR